MNSMESISNTEYICDCVYSFQLLLLRGVVPFFRFDWIYFEAWAFACMYFKFSWMNVHFWNWIGGHSIIRVTDGLFQLMTRLLKQIIQTISIVGTMFLIDYVQCLFYRIQHFVHGLLYSVCLPQNRLNVSDSICMFHMQLEHNLGFSWIEYLWLD